MLQKSSESIRSVFTAAAKICVPLSIAPVAAAMVLGLPYEFPTHPVVSGLLGVAGTITYIYGTLVCADKLEGYGPS
jgi:hypothetical protein